jgi:TMEM175 potassium channel family protein
MPFSTGMLAEFITFRLPLVLYWLNLLLLGALLFAGRRYGVRAGLVRDDVAAEMLGAGERRIVVYQALYAGCLLVGLVSTYAGIALLVLLQLNSAIAPGSAPLDRF